MKKLLLLSTAILFATVSIFANNLRITNIEQVGLDKVKFNLSWENCWYVGGSPGNHDVAWVFIKYRPCGAGGSYTHALLSITMGDHDFGLNFYPATDIKLEDRFNIVPAGATQVNGLGNNKGVMIRRDGYGKGNISGDVTLKVASSAGDPFLSGVDYEFKVIGIEMVKVGEEPFAAGDASSSNHFTNGYMINSEAVIPADQLLAAHAEIPEAYPKGFNSFYCMKYEISEGQFGVFMQSGSPYPGSPATYTGQNRNNLTPGGETTTPDRAQNYMNLADLYAYLDWACLRPMTELEYEKACKGPGTFADQSFAWGGDATTIQNAWYVSGPEDGTEMVSTINANAHFWEQYSRSFTTPPPGWQLISGPSCNYTGQRNWKVLSDPECSDVDPAYDVVTGCRSYGVLPVMECGSSTTNGFGPLGCGIFARDATVSREATGATYYGIMEMSGNVMEQTINITATSYEGSWGNGDVSDAPVDWPTALTDRTLRGGGYGSDRDRLRIADRLWAGNTSDRIGPNTNYNGRKGDIGGRGVR